jgi:hypothetical protein
MSLMTKYCEYCGKELKIVESRFYDTTTGKKLMRYESCNIKDCKHGDHKYRFGILKCKLCGASLWRII